MRSLSFDRRPGRSLPPRLPALQRRSPAFLICGVTLFRSGPHFRRDRHGAKAALVLNVVPAPRIDLHYPAFPTRDHVKLKLDHVGAHRLALSRYLGTERCCSHTARAVKYILTFTKYMMQLTRQQFVDFA